MPVPEIFEIEILTTVRLVRIPPVTITVLLSASGMEQACLNRIFTDYTVDFIGQLGPTLVFTNH